MGIVGSNASRINNSTVKFIIYPTAVKKEMIQTAHNKSSKIRKIKTVLPFDTQFYLLSLGVRSNLVGINKCLKAAMLSLFFLITFISNVLHYNFSSICGTSGRNIYCPDKLGR